MSDNWRSKYLDSLTSDQCITFFAIEKLKEQIKFLNEKIRAEQVNCKHDFIFMSMHERSKECRVCGIDESAWNYYSKNRS